MWLEIRVNCFNFSLILKDSVGFINDLSAEFLHNFVMLSVTFFIFLVVLEEIAIFKHIWVTLEVLSTLIGFIDLFSFSFVDIFGLSFYFSYLKYVLNSDLFNFLNLFFKINNVAKYLGCWSLLSNFFEA